MALEDAGFDVAMLFADLEPILEQRDGEVGHTKQGEFPGAILFVNGSSLLGDWCLVVRTITIEDIELQITSTADQTG